MTGRQREAISWWLGRIGRHGVFGVILCAIIVNGCVLLVPGISGCTDAVALNHRPGADVDDGSCTYSQGGFYASANQYEHVPDPSANQLFLIPIDSIVVRVEGSTLGKLRGYFPNGPENCSAKGTLNYSFGSGDAVEWSAVVLLRDGRRVMTSGTARPRPGSKCVLVDVTG